MSQIVTKYYVDTHGNYLGGFYNCSPNNGIEIPAPPEHGMQKYDMKKKTWSDLAEATGENKIAAMAALAQSDQTVLRLLENGVTIPADWKQYRQELRKIAKGDKKEKPPKEPNKPAGI